MSALVLEAGAFIAVDRDERSMIARLRVAQIHGHELRTSATGNPIDATVVVVDRSGDRILTSDPDDIARLASRSGKQVAVVPC